MALAKLHEAPLTVCMSRLVGSHVQSTAGSTSGCAETVVCPARKLCNVMEG